MTTIIAPSILSADFSKLGDEIKAIDEAGCDWIHIDVMDGHFVPNITIGADVVKALRSKTERLFDVHLMINPVEPFIESFAKAGADIITIHAETGFHLDRNLATIRSLGKKAGVSLNPATHESCLNYILDKVDLILLMTVNPGFGGQSFIESQLEKISKVKEMIGDRPINLQVDGGINPMTASQCVAAGANVLVAGSAVFKGSDYKSNIEALRV